MLSKKQWIFTLAVIVTIPAGVRAQGTALYTVDARGGVAVPTGRLNDVAKSGPAFGLEFARRVGTRLQLALDGNYNRLNGVDFSTGVQSPDMTLLHYTAAVGADLLKPARKLSIVPKVGAGAAWLDTDTFNDPVAGTQNNELRHTYFTAHGGLDLGYRLGRATVFAGSDAYWTALKKADTQSLADLDASNRAAFGASWTFPINIGVSARM